MMPELKHLFDAEGRLAMGIALRSRPLLVFDFDGTLAPIVARADDARVTAAVAERLCRLARIRPLGVVTGRAVDDVTRRLGFTPRFIVGNHGAEDADLAPAFDVAPLALVRARVLANAEELRMASIVIEDKRYSLALHYRLATSAQQAVELIEAMLADLPSALRCYAGKCVVNVVVSAAPDKCDAITSLVERADCALAVFVGDDVNDEPVFERAERNWLTVRVGRDDPNSRAGFFLDSEAEVPVLLDRMLAELESR
jgi:trehalose 6-phosphate phosphatase